MPASQFQFGFISMNKFSLYSTLIILFVMQDVSAALVGSVGGVDKSAPDYYAVIRQFDGAEASVGVPFFELEVPDAPSIGISGEVGDAKYSAIARNDKLGFSVDQVDRTDDNIVVTTSVYVARKYVISPVSFLGSIFGVNVKIVTNFNAELYASPEYVVKMNGVIHGYSPRAYAIVSTYVTPIDESNLPIDNNAGVYLDDFESVNAGDSLVVKKPYIVPVSIDQRTEIFFGFEGGVIGGGFIHATNSLDFDYFETDPGAALEINGKVLYADANGRISASAVPDITSSVDETSTLQLALAGFCLAAFVRLSKCGKV